MRTTRTIPATRTRMLMRFAAPSRLRDRLPRTRRGAVPGWLITVIAVTICILLLIAIAVPALNKARRGAYLIKDASQIREIHRNMLTYAEQDHGVLPTPGRFKPHRSGRDGAEHSGPAEENPRQNTTRNLYAMMIALEYFNPDLLVSEWDTNPNIQICTNYDFDRYQPADDVFWDGDVPGPVPDEAAGNFFTRLDGSDGLPCHASYHHLVLTGIRRTARWRATASYEHVHMGNRGTNLGVTEGREFTHSYAMGHSGRKEPWMNLVFASNHTETVRSFYPSLVTYQPDHPDGKLTRDNIYAAEFDDAGGRIGPFGNLASGDAFLAMVHRVNRDLPGDADAVIYREPLAPSPQAARRSPWSPRSAGTGGASGS